MLQHRVWECLPILRSVGKIILDDRPDNVQGSRGITVVNQPLGIGDESNRSQGRTVTLRSAPFPLELGKIDHKLGLSQTSPVREGARGVGNTLKLGLRGDVVLDVDLEICVVVLDKGVDNELKDKRGISSPSKPVYSSD